MANIALPNPAQQSDINASLLQAVAAIPLIPSVVTVTPLVPASTTYTYIVVAKVNGSVAPSLATSSTTGASSLAAATPNTLSWNPSPNNSPANSPAAVYDVYRSVGGATQGKIASNISATSLVDSGLVGDGTTAPAFNTSATLQVAAASGAITIGAGTVAITVAGVGVMTLPVPVAGPVSGGGQDGSTLVIVDTTGHAHTVTTPANGINGTLHIATFGGTVGQAVEFKAYNGKWYAALLNGVTIS